MRRLLAMLLIGSLALAAPGCKQQPQGTPRAVVIGGDPKVRDPALGPLQPADAVLLANVAQGLVRFDASGDIVGGLAERWNVSDDGLSYIFRIASTQWPDGRKVTAQQVARLLKRQLTSRSRNTLKDAAGAIEDVVAMTDRVVEIQLLAPRPTLLSLLAQPEFAILNGSQGTGPFKAAPSSGRPGELRLSREIVNEDDETTTRDEVLLAGAAPADAINAFATGRADLVLGGTFNDLPLTRKFKLPRGALRFDPASGLLGLVPVRSSGAIANPEMRQMLSQALDRAGFVAALGVPDLAARATLLQPGLDGTPDPAVPAWFGVPPAARLPALQQQADRLFGKTKRVIIVALPEGYGADILYHSLVHDWGALGITVIRTGDAKNADFALIDEVAPSASPSWFVRQFRCGEVPICDSQADALMEAARLMPVPAQRYALLAQAAARIDDAQLFLPITAPVRWSLVSSRIQDFAGNRYASHTLTDLDQQVGKE